MNILLLGSGGRECALAWKISQSPLCSNLYIAPGNGGTGLYGQNVDLKPTDFDAVGRFVNDNQIQMVVAGNEDPLVLGLREALAASCPDILVVGPGADGARLEGSKDFAKDFMTRHDIPTAAYKSFTADTLEEGQRFLASLQAPYVLKADGLAAGKGVLIIDSLPQAQEALGEMLGGMFGKSSATVVVEEFLNGIECSVFVLTDGHGNYRILPVAKDYKRIHEGDQGPNTGGMGAVSPVCFANADFMHKVEQRIIKPTIQGLIDDGIDYRGFIFFGLINVDGQPMVIEYNVRMGDPETEAVMPRIASDLVPLLEAAAKGNLADLPLEHDPRSAVTVMAVSQGYPGAYEKGKYITLKPAPEDVNYFHAGTKLLPEGQIVTNGGRVLAVTALSALGVEGARQAAYDALEKGLAFDGMAFRRDIALDLLRIS